MLCRRDSRLKEAAKLPVKHSGLRFESCRRGYFSVNGSLANTDGVLPDTYLDIGNFDWAKGLAFINGFNLVRASSMLIIKLSNCANGD